MKDQESTEILSLREAIRSRDQLIEELTREKSSLLKIISHDIRSPFNRIFALLQLIELDFGEITPEQKKYIDQMYRSVFGGMEMVKNLRDSRAIDEGKISVSLERIPVFESLKEGLKSMNTQAKLKQIYFSLHEKEEDPEIHADKSLLLKIYENILSNCIKYSDEGSGVDINPRIKDDVIQIDFVDQGPGIPEEEIEMVFDKFRKLTPLPTLGENTTGLGLYLTKYFADMMKGSVSLRNGEEKGLVVTLAFPLIRGQEE